MIKKKIEVVILSSNRPYFLIQAIKSALRAKNRVRRLVDCKLIVSDNSDDESCIKHIKKLNVNNDIIIRSIRSKLDIFNHFKKVISEASSDYIIIFHDDDIMKSNFIEDLYLTIDNHPDCIAAASNGIYIDELGRGHGNLWGGKFTDHHYKKMSSDELFEAYFSYGSHGICPFPGYIYRTKLIKNKGLDYSKGGKYSDVSFLYDLTKLGSILWINKVGMEYRRHSNNDSNSIILDEQISLLRYLKSENYNNVHLRDFRFRIWLNWLLYQKKQIKINLNYRLITVTKYIISSLITKYIWNYKFILYIYNKIITNK